MPIKKIAGLLALALFGLLLHSAAQAADCSAVGYVQAQGGYYKASDHSGPYALDTNCAPWLMGGAGLTPTDRTIASASGASQQIMAANASRHSLTIENTGSANCGINPRGGTAVIGGAGTLTLVPNGSYTPRIPTLSAVTVICTAGQPIYADEN
jgi:opacity protein-like surface antigen